MPLAVPARPQTHPTPHPRHVPSPALGHTGSLQAICPLCFEHLTDDGKPPAPFAAGAETKIRAGADTSSSWTSLRREQAPPMGRGQASPQGREASTTSSPATTSALSFLTDVIVGAGSSTQPRPSAPSVSSSRPPNPAPRTPSAPSRYLPSSPCLFARILLTHPLPIPLPLSQALGRQWRAGCPPCGPLCSLPRGSLPTLVDSADTFVARGERMHFVLLRGMFVCASRMRAVSSSLQ